MKALSDQSATTLLLTRELETKLAGLQRQALQSKPLEARLQSATSKLQHHQAVVKAAMEEVDALNLKLAEARKQAAEADMAVMAAQKELEEVTREVGVRAGLSSAASTAQSKEQRLRQLLQQVVSKLPEELKGFAEVEVRKLDEDGAETPIPGEDDAMGLTAPGGEAPEKKARTAPGTGGGNTEQSQTQRG